MKCSGAAMFEQVAAHVRFVLRPSYPQLAYVAIVGRAAKLCGTLTGWAVTPLYKRWYDPKLQSRNVLYDFLAPWLRQWFVRLSGQPFTVDSILHMIATERRGAVLFELLFTLLQISLYSIPWALLPLTIVGVLVNAVPRQFYAQLKILMRSLHLSYLARTGEQLISSLCMPLSPSAAAQLTYGGRPVLSATGEEAPAAYMAFGGSHHGGCWEVVVRETADFVLSFVGGMLMLYLLLVAAAQGLRLTGGLDTGRLEELFPFAAVTTARLAKSACNWLTTENLLRAVAARQTQNELYLLQRCAVVRSVHAEAAEYVNALATHSGACARAPFAFVGTPCLKHEASCDFTVPVMALFAFLALPHLPVEKYASMLDDALVPPWSKLDRSNTRTLEGARPPPFESQSQLDSTRAYASGLLWRLFDVSSHTHCGANPVHTVVCKHHAQEEI